MTEPSAADALDPPEPAALRDLAEAHDPPGPGLGTGDVYLAALYSLLACGTLLTLFMTYEEPSPTFVRLCRLVDALPWQTTPHGLVGSSLITALAGCFVVFLAVRSASPPLRFDAFNDWRRADQARGLVGTLLAGVAVLTGLSAWYLVALLS